MLTKQGNTDFQALQNIPLYVVRIYIDLQNICSRRHKEQETMLRRGGGDRYFSAASRLTPELNGVEAIRLPYTIRTEATR
jgi:hypothetical protein